MAELQRDRDLVLAPGEYAYYIDSTKGLVNVSVGPHKVSLSGTDNMVVLNPHTRRFDRMESTQSATMSYVNVPEGEYVVLQNPADSEKAEEQHPREGTSSPAMRLRMGRKVNIPGPDHFPLWPGQIADVLAGHHLHHNQYLVVRVYNEDEAKRNWSSAVMRRQTGASEQVGDEIMDTPPNLTMGQLMVVNGTEVSFYIPPTGIEVLQDVDSEHGESPYVREAVTLERLEYCILLSENGNKRYVQGPDVVFPKPTENFVKDENGNRKFKAIELNLHSGVHVKVIADYSENGKEHTIGEELFITGEEQAIYFPREEHSLITYGDRMVHFAIAIPTGEGRYVLDRDKGTVDLVTGPIMYLPDPRNTVVVRRVLDQKTVTLLYPGNLKAAEINRTRESETVAATQAMIDMDDLPAGARPPMATRSLMQQKASTHLMPDAFRRSSSYHGPRTITLDTKYDGAIAINVWTGYAILIVDKSGKRRVEQGPTTVLLAYDETPMAMSLSTGKPKTTDQLLGTVYLRITNNVVSDIVRVETRDLIPVDIKLSYRVNFIGDDPVKWFAVENYVKFLTDHLRSIISNCAKRIGIEEFYNNAIDIVRDAVLGPVEEGVERVGRTFAENQMHVYDVEVLNVAIQNPAISALLVRAQSETLSGAIEVSSEEAKLMWTRRLEAVKREVAKETAVTDTALHETLMEQIARTAAQTIASLQADINRQQVQKTLTDERLSDERQIVEQALIFDAKRQALDLDRLAKESEFFKQRAEAISERMVTAMQLFGDKVFMEKLASALGPIALLNNRNVADVLDQLFKDTPLQAITSTLAARPQLTTPPKTGT